MREKGWLCRPRKKEWVCTTDSNHNLPIYPNLIRDLSLDRINQPGVSDITYVCFIYPAVILEESYRICTLTQLTLTALRMAIVNRNPPQGCIHHSDRGVQYASADYVKELEFYGFKISIGRKGNPYDSAFAESFMKTLKSEEVHLWEYRTMEDVQKRIPYFIEDGYNHKRHHSSLGYHPPYEFEMMLESTPGPCQNTLITTL